MYYLEYNDGDGGEIFEDEETAEHMKLSLNTIHGPDYATITHYHKDPRQRMIDDFQSLNGMEG